MRRKIRRTDIPTTERRSHRPDRAEHDDLMQRRRDALLRAAARQVDW
jgi:hypothetical protein